MKKWGILVLVLLGGLLLSMQYLINRGEKKAAPQQPITTPAEQVGVALPPSATATYVMPEVTYSAGSGDYSNFGLPRTASTYKGACQGGSLNDIVAAHGKIWGYFAPKANLIFERKESEAIYKFMPDYVGCLAMSRADIGLCDTLPGEINTDEVKIPADISLRMQCRKKVAQSLFYDYLLGKTKDSAACQASLTDWQPANLAKITVQDYCQAASGGMESLRNYLMKAMPEYAKEGKKYYPVAKADCSGDVACLSGFKLYSAIKSGDNSGCQAMGGPSCEALVGRADSPCENIAREISSAYCASVERIKKKTGGYIGVSKDEMQADMTAKMKARDAEELQKKENEKLMTEINKKAKKVLGKE